jgi:hypothetical protein
MHFVVEIVRKSANFRPAIMLMARKEFDKRAVEKQFGVGDIVYVQRPPHLGPRMQKFQIPYESPFIVTQSLEHNNVVLQDC